MDSAEKLDQQLLDNALTMHKNSGVAILARPELPEDTQRVNAPGLARLLSILGRVFEYVVIDSVMSVDPLYASVMKAADLNVLVMELTVPTAHSVERFMKVLQRMGVDQDRTRVVVNRATKRDDMVRWLAEPSGARGR